MAWPTCACGTCRTDTGWFHWYSLCIEVCATPSIHARCPSCQQGGFESMTTLYLYALLMCGANATAVVTCIRHFRFKSAVGVCATRAAIYCSSPRQRSSLHLPVLVAWCILTAIGRQSTIYAHGTSHRASKMAASTSNEQLGSVVPWTLVHVNHADREVFRQPLPYCCCVHVPGNEASPHHHNMKNCSQV